VPDNPTCPDDQDCEGIECGADPVCGETCDWCGSPLEQCSVDNLCVSREPYCPDEKQCSSRECGLDPMCGLTCGSCEVGETCTSTEYFAFCYQTPPDCPGAMACGSQACGPDPICRLECGPCADGSVCEDGSCVAPSGPIWAMRGFDPQHSSRSTYRGPRSGNARKLAEGFDGNVYRISLVIGSDGTVYAQTTKERLYAIAPDGSERWVYASPTTSGNNYTSPAVAADDTVYTVRDGGLHALNSSGVLQWVFPFTDSNSPIESPVVGDDGTIYVRAGVNLHAVQPSGAEKWTRLTGAGFSFDPLMPVLDSQGQIYVVNDETLIALDQNGDEAWTVDLGYEIYHPMVGPGGTVFVGIRDPLIGQYGGKRVLALKREDGALFWEQTVADGGLTSVPRLGAIEADGGLVQGALSAAAFSFSPQGYRRWITQLSYLESGVEPTIDAEGSIYFSNPDFWEDIGRITALSSTGEVLQEFTWDYTIYSISGPVIIADRKLYFAAGPELWVVEE